MAKKSKTQRAKASARRAEKTEQAQLETVALVQAEAKADANKAKKLFSKKSVDEIAREVIAGKWGNGQDRKNRLTKAGYEYNTVQKRVNEMLGKLPQPSKKSIDEIAREVILGKWGNGADRKNRLIKAGYDYDAVQNRVNELMHK